jgi:4-phytase/acid phosphatase
MKKPWYLTLVLGFATLALVTAGSLAAQSVDDTQLKQVIVFGRHSVRSPVMANTTLNQFSVQPYPDFGVSGPGILTDNGRTLETILGGYYRLWLTQEGLLTGQDATDAGFVYFRANSIERTVESAKAFAAGLLPAATVSVNHYPPQESDPLFDPVGSGVALLDERRAIASVKGRLGGNGESLSSSYAAELALTRSVLFGYPAGQSPAPTTPAPAIDVTTVPIHVTAGTPPMSIDLGGLTLAAVAVDPFIMEYADGRPLSDVGWGQLTPEGISQTSRLTNLTIDLSCRTPYLAGVQGSNLASHVVRSMVQAATGHAMTGALGDPSTKMVVLIASDTNISALASLFHLEWTLTGYQGNFCAPGGAVVFELRQSLSTGGYLVRASYVAQTLDQLRNRTPLTLAAPPATAPLFIPGCSKPNATFDCPLAGLVKVAKQAIDPQSADTMN